MALTMKQRMFFGQFCEQKVYNVPTGTKKLKEYDPEKTKKERFESEEAYAQFKMDISRRNHIRLFHANFSPTSLYSTHTFDDEYEIHTFEEAKIIRKRFVGSLKRKYKDAVIFLYMGRGKTTNRIHFHMVSEGIPEDFIVSKWKYGKIRHCQHLREHCWFEGQDRGQDYTGLANYLFNHWTEEIGGHHWFMTKNAKRPEVEEAKEVKVRGGYSEKRPPVAPKGYKLVDIEATKYGYWCFRYIVIPQRDRSRSPGKHRLKGRMD